jgi:hypothetical protein
LELGKQAIWIVQRPETVSNYLVGALVDGVRARPAQRADAELHLKARRKSDPALADRTELLPTDYGRTADRPQPILGFREAFWRLGKQQDVEVGVQAAGITRP